MANISDVVNSVSEKTGLSKTRSKEALEAVLDTITDYLEIGEEVKFVGFGLFRVAERQSRKGRNPKTNEEVFIPAKKSPVFKAGKTLKEIVE